MNRNKYAVMIAEDSVRVYQIFDPPEGPDFTIEEVQAMETLLTVGHFGSYAGYVVEAYSETMAIFEAGKESGRAEHE